MMVETPPQPRYEFFISRAGADAAVAKEVADVLRHAGHTVQYQDEDIPFGANFIERMSQLVEGCKHLLVILSPAYLGSPYCREEWTNFLADLFADQDDRRVVVLLAHDWQILHHRRVCLSSFWRLLGGLVDTCAKSPNPCCQP
jgi:hypothetical protein